MEWWLALLILIGGLLFLFALGIPVAFAFLIIDIIGVILFCSGEGGLRQILALGLRASVLSFTYLPLVLFVLMGAVLFHSGIALNAVDAIDKWLGRVPGRLGLLAVVSGVLLAALSGVSMASAALLGSVLTPEMERRGYKKVISLGPIMASGGLASLIPPSLLSVLTASIAETEIGAVLIAGILPGLLLAFIYAMYIIVRCWIDPSLAPSYEVAPTPTAQKLLLTTRYVLPLGLIIFLVTGVIMVGAATPSEAAATGTVGSIILAACYGKLNWSLVKKTMTETLGVSVMLYMIIATAVIHGQVLSFSGVSQALSQLLISLPVPAIALVIILQIILIILGMFIGTVPLLFIIIPIFIPVVQAAGLSPVWFCATLVLNAEMSGITPPFGLVLFVMKGVAPRGTTSDDIYRAAIPWVCIDTFVLALMVAFPAIVLWLPSMMH